MAAFPGRSWVAIGAKAGKLKISRQWVKGVFAKGRWWTDEEKEKLRNLYSKAPIDDIARELRRSRGAVVWMAHDMGLSRPKELRYKRPEPIWEPITTKLFQEESLPSNSLEKLDDDIQGLLLQLAEFLRSTPAIPTAEEKP